jgi:hypothetical protein
MQLSRLAATSWRRLLPLMVVAFSPIAVLGADGPTTRPLRGIGEMTVEEVRDEVHQLYRDDLPYAGYMKRLITAADTAWPYLNSSGRIEYEVDIYGPLMDAMRLLNLQPALRYQSIIEISEAIDASRLTREYEPFYREVFASPEFRGTTSAFHDTVVDLWRRYQAANKTVPYTELLLLNQDTMGTPNGQNHESLRAAIGDCYAGVGDPASAATWYDRISPASLGPLRAADAYYAAHDYAAAVQRYRAVLAGLDAWAELKPQLLKQSLAYPLESVDLGQVKAHAETREADCKQRLSTSKTTTAP